MYISHPSPKHNGLYISQIIKYTDNGRLLVYNLVEEGFKTFETIKFYSRRFYCRYKELLQHLHALLTKPLWSCALLTCSIYISIRKEITVRHPLINIRWCDWLCSRLHGGCEIETGKVYSSLTSYSQNRGSPSVVTILRIKFALNLLC